MAGSYNHLINDRGEFTMDLIDNLGDAYEACEECIWMIHFLAGGDPAKIKAAHDAGNAVGWKMPEPLHEAK